MYDIACQPEIFNSSESYTPMVESTGKQVMLSKILKATNQIVDTMINKKNNVLVHCSDGWDRTGQLCALA